jgi:neutral ceramidase
MSGYANRDQPHKGVHDDIFARAFVFDDGKNKTCLIQADLIGFPFEFVDEVSAEIEKKTGIAKANCLIIAAHNHGAPTTRAYGEQATEKLTAYLADLKKKLVATATEAYTKRVPVSIGFGKGKCTMNINRRARHHEGGIWLGRNPDGPCDHDVDVIRLNNASKEVIGLMVNWPCHATAGGQENYSITGDWPGSAARYVNKNFKEGLPVAITAGASGDINPIYGPGNNFGEIDAIGLVLGEEIVRVAKGNDNTQAVGTVSVLQREIQVPGKERSATRMPNEKLVPSDPVKIRLTVVKIGAMVMVGISGEVMTEIGMKIKAQSPFSNTTMVTHCNGSSGYLCTDAAYQEGGYEALASRTMPGVEKIIVDNVLGMLGEL